MVTDVECATEVCDLGMMHILVDEHFGVLHFESSVGERLVSATPLFLCE